MKFNQILQRFFGANKLKTSPSQSGTQADNSEKMQKMLSMLSNTQDIELTCEDVFAVLDQFAELAARGEDMTKLMPLVKHHLDMCPDCQDEYKVLESIIQNAV